jgi:glycosyltransferase involved in cell wall biosynthesis
MSFMDVRMFEPSKVVALIPAYREELYIGDVVRRVKVRLKDVLVIDDGSPDETTLRAREAGAEVIIHPENLGKGAAIKTGFNALLKRGFDYVLILDGDGQHLPEEIDRFLAAASETPAEIYIGNRMDDTARMPWVRRLANRFMSWQISRLCGHHVPDTQCGFRMIRRELIPRLFCESNAFDYETEMLLIAGQAGQRIHSVPITTIYGNEVSKINPIRDGIRFFKLISRY